MKKQEDEAKKILETKKKELQSKLEKDLSSKEEIDSLKKKFEEEMIVQAHLIDADKVIIFIDFNNNIINIHLNKLIKILD